MVAPINVSPHSFGVHKYVISLSRNINQEFMLLPTPLKKHLHGYLLEPQPLLLDYHYCYVGFLLIATHTFNLVLIGSPISMQLPS